MIFRELHFAGSPAKTHLLFCYLQQIIPLTYSILQLPLDIELQQSLAAQKYLYSTISYQHWLNIG